MIGIRAVNRWELIYYLLLILFLVTFAVYDMQHKRVPDLALAYFLPFALLSLPVNLMAEGESSLPPWLMPALGILFGGGTLLFEAIVTNGRIGGGDIKLTAMLGIVYGPYNILLALFFAALLAILFDPLEKRRTGNRVFSSPFVPFLAIGCCVVTILKFITIEGEKLI